MPNELINLPLETLAILVAGYLGYWIATIGLNAKQKKLDSLFQILVYGSIGRMAAELSTPFLKSQGLEWLTPVSTVLMAIIVAALWRAKGRASIVFLMRKLGVHYDDHQLSALSSITEAKALWHTLSVHLEDGTILESHFAEFKDKKLPLGGGPRIDQDGNVALYVTRIFRPDSTDATFTAIDEYERSEITFVPVAKIAKIDVLWR